MRPSNQLADTPAHLGEQTRRALRYRFGLTPVWVVLFALVVLLLTTLDVIHHGVLTDFDHDVSRRMLDWDLRDTVWPKRLVYLLTLPGQRGTVLLFTIPTVVYLAWRARSVTPLVRYGVALVAMTIAVYVLKEWVGRPAPVFNLHDPPTPTSYPSGHVANALLMWGVVWWSARDLDPRMLLTRILNVVRLFGPILVVIGMTLLDYHWISDFIGGACVGIVLLGAVTRPGWQQWCAPIDRRIWSGRLAA